MSKKLDKKTKKALKSFMKAQKDFSKFMKTHVKKMSDDEPSSKEGTIKSLMKFIKGEFNPLKLEGSDLNFQRSAILNELSKFNKDCKVKYHLVRGELSLILIVAITTDSGTKYMNCFIRGGVYVRIGVGDIPYKRDMWKTLSKNLSKFNKAYNFTWTRYMAH